MRRLYAAGLVAALTLGVSACGAEDPEPNFADPSPTMDSSTSTGTPSPPESSESERPVQPASVNKASIEGAIAFTRYFWQVANYAQTTGDLEEFRRITNSSCRACQGAIESIKQTNRPGFEVKGGNASVTQASGQVFSPMEGETGATVNFSVRNTRQRIIRDGKTVEVYDASTVKAQFLMTKTSSGWRVDVWSFR